MSVSDEFEWAPDQTRREHAVLANFSHLIKTERSRYGNQAIQLLEKSILNQKLMVLSSFVWSNPILICVGFKIRISPEIVMRLNFPFQNPKKKC